jgi:hypothetical protein
VHQEPEAWLIVVRSPAFTRDEAAYCEGSSEEAKRVSKNVLDEPDDAP